MARRTRTAPIPAALVARISDDEIQAIIDRAQVDGDRYTISEGRRAMRGDIGARIACAMILGR